MTDNDAIIRLHEKRQRGRELKRLIATIRDDLKVRAKYWNELARYVTDSDSLLILPGEEKIKIFNPQSSRAVHRSPGRVVRPEEEYAEIASFSKSHFDGEQLFSLLQQLADAKQELSDVQKFCRDAGDPLEGD